MPTYVYKGLTTGEEFEIQQRITEAPLTHHPQTGEPVKRVIQAAGIVFKGSGFYKTDSRSSGGGSSKKSDSSDSSAKSESGDSSTKSESSPKAESSSASASSSSGSAD